MTRFIHFGLMTFCLLMGYGLLSTTWAQPDHLSKTLAAKTLTKVRASQLAGYSLEQLKAIKPTSSNPYLSLLPAGVASDMAYWKARLQAEAVAKRAAQTRGTSGPVLDETEPNDDAGTGNPVGDFGNGAGQTPATDIRGDFPEPPAATPIGPFIEDDGAIPIANDAGLSTGQRAVVSAILGDGPHGAGGSGSGDFDFYAISGVTAGQIIIADINTQPAVGQLAFDSFLVIWDSAGNVLAFNDDASAINRNSFILDSFLLFSVPEDGTYYISVGSFGAPAPRDPFDSASGPGAFTEGFYSLELALDGYDTDYFTVSLNAGDVLNVNGFGAISHVTLFDSAGVEPITSDLDITSILPEEAPFSAGGNPALLYVASQAETYSVRVTGNRAGTYLTELRTARPPLETAGAEAKQILFVDFDGEVVDISAFLGGASTAWPKYVTSLTGVP